MTMPLAVVGVSHETAPVDIREKVAFGSAEAGDALLALRKEAGVDEAVILSTCNRTEVYLFPVREERPIRAVERLLAGKAGPTPRPLGSYVFQEWGEGAVRHLFHVSAGLDSMVTGEAEIQGQVKEAYQRASTLPVFPPMAGPVLNRLFQMALAVGGRIRSETPIGEGTASVASVAVELARKIFGSLKGKRVLILGAGIAGELIAEALTREGVEGVVVATRTYDRAVNLARKHRGHAIPFEKIHEALPSVDIVLSSTAAPYPVLTRSIVRDSFQEPRRHPLLIIDIAVPRDVDPAVGDEPEVFLYNVDDLRKIVDEHVRTREGALPEAQRIIAAHSEEFRSWYASLEVVPVIQDMRKQAKAFREAELERLFRGLAHVSPEDRERIEAFARRLQNKLLHDPTVRLREGMAAGGGPGLVDAARLLYGLDEVQAADERRGRDERAALDEEAPKKGSKPDPGVP
ncbi:MAG: glutamyl-tRNA reductase [Gemmatimonadetes bacterium]|nr:glutamyl-tRNA reductase [Gemmatimonadota bacterium]